MRAKGSEVRPNGASYTGQQLRAQKAKALRGMGEGGKEGQRQDFSPFERLTVHEPMNVPIVSCLSFSRHPRALGG